MTRRSLAFASSILVTGVLALSACGVNVDEVKDAAGRPETTTRLAADQGATSTTSGNDAGRSTTTARPDTTGSASDAEAGPYVEAMTESMLDDDDVPITEDQARCYAGKAIEIIAVDRLQSKGITPDDLRDDSALDLSDVGLSMDEGNALYDAFEDCDIDLRELMLASMGEGEEVPAGVEACLDQVLTDDNLRKMMVISIVKGDDAMENDPELEQITGGLMGCMFMAMGSDTTTR
ncbi:MAG TPA: hypothetical protein VFN21_11650 [Acidimicrobiales bacterium]|nr:hypothetical protein [Acidimicrobiales bacterium]